MAGGHGARFWPLSRRARPKQCLSLDGGPTLLQQTVERLEPWIPKEHVLVVTGPDMVGLVRSQLPSVPHANVLVEPSARNTAPAIGWATAEVARRAGGEAICVVLPSDHAVREPEVLRRALQIAATAAAHTGAVVTLGLQPDRPATGFGYLERGIPVDIAAEAPVHRVARFVEKPPQDVAESFLAGGKHAWNAGMFVFRADAMLAALAQHLPRTAAALDAIIEHPESLAAQWGETDAVSIDHGVMERHHDTLMVETDPGWSDLGAWDQAAAWLPTAPGGRGLARRIVSIDSNGCTVHALDKAVALVGLQDVVVVDTADALLVVHAERAQDVRAVLDTLVSLGDDDLL
jgi:mannose-1-phosphate guanylyltransferase